MQAASPAGAENRIQEIDLGILCKDDSRTCAALQRGHDLSVPADVIRTLGATE
jgi:hypothetical protein